MTKCQLRWSRSEVRLAANVLILLPVFVFIMTTILSWMLVFFTLPIIVLFWPAESRCTRIQRYRSQGLTWNQIASRFNVSSTTARRWSAP